VVLEAQASGIPVIVSDLGGPCENILDGRNGTICKADDAESLLAAIRTLLASPERRRTMGQAARQYLEERSFENAFLSLWEQYQEPLPAPVALRAAG